MYKKSNQVTHLVNSICYIIKIYYAFKETFQQFDYGPEENIKVYDCSHPPKYNLSNIIAPIAFYYAKNDLLADPQVRK